MAEDLLFLQYPANLFHYQTKIEKGWRPNQAPLGYLNDGATKTITKDPAHFPLIRKMFELMLTGAYSPKDIAIVARDKWGFRTPTRKRIGGGPLAMSSIYKLLSNPFYAGIIVWNGQTYPGKHEPIVSIDEFREVRRLLERPGRPKPQRQTFAFTGMIGCADCGRHVTAEHKVNRYGYRYVYYHCSKSGLTERCPQPSIEIRALEQQVVGVLRTVQIDRALENWIFDEIAIDLKGMRIDEHARSRSLERALSDIRHQLDELTGLRLRNLLMDKEFISERKKLQEEQLRLESAIAKSDQHADPIEPFSDLISFSSRAIEWFSCADNSSKRLILETVASNLFLKDGTLSFEAKKPFIELTKTAAIPHQLGVVDDVRTFNTRCDQVRQIITEVREALNTEEGELILRNIRTLRRTFEPEVMAERDAEHARRAKAAARACRWSGDGGSSRPPLVA